MGRSAIVGLLEEVNRAGKRAARRAARVYTCWVHVHQAAEPSSPASTAPLHAHVPTTNQENVRMVPCLAARQQQCAARRNSPHFFPKRWQSPYSSLVIHAMASEAAIFRHHERIDSFAYPLQ